MLANSKTTDSFAYAGPLSETVQLGNVATRVPGVTLEWDVEGMKFPNKPDAEKLLTKTYREGWKIEPVLMSTAAI